MTGKSKYSDKVQKTVVELILEDKEYETYLNYNSLPIPSKWTVDRWVDTWRPIIWGEIAEEKRLSKIKQDRARKKHDKSKETKVEQDEISSFFRVPLTFLPVYIEVCHNWLSSYKNKDKNKDDSAIIRRRERIQIELERIKKEVDK